MKTPNLPRLLLLALLLAQLTACKTQTEPRPLADLNALQGRWASLTEIGFEFEFDPATRSAKYTKVITGNRYGFKVGDVTLKNVEAVDETTYRGELLYRSGSGYFVFADVKFNLAGDEWIYTSDAGSISGSLTVSGQTGKLKRVP